MWLSDCFVGMYFFQFYSLRGFEDEIKVKDNELDKLRKLLQTSEETLSNCGQQLDVYK